MHGVKRGSIIPHMYLDLVFEEIFFAIGSLFACQRFDSDS